MGFLGRLGDMWAARYNSQTSLDMGFASLMSEFGDSSGWI